MGQGRPLIQTSHLTVHPSSAPDISLTRSQQSRLNSALNTNNDVPSQRSRRSRSLSNPSPRPGPATSQSRHSHGSEPGRRSSNTGVAISGVRTSTAMAMPISYQNRALLDERLEHGRREDARRELWEPYVLKYPDMEEIIYDENRNFGPDPRFFVEQDKMSNVPVRVRYNNKGDIRRWIENPSQFEDEDEFRGRKLGPHGWVQRPGRVGDEDDQPLYNAALPSSATRKTTTRKSSSAKKSAQAAKSSSAMT